MLETLVLLGLGAILAIKFAEKEYSKTVRAEKPDEPHEDLEPVGGFNQPMWSPMPKGSARDDTGIMEEGTPDQWDQWDSFSHTRGMSFSWNRKPASKFLFKPFRPPAMNFQDLKHRVMQREKKIQEVEHAGGEKRRTPFLTRFRMSKLFSGLGEPVFSTPRKKNEEISAIVSTGVRRPHATRGRITNLGASGLYGYRTRGMGNIQFREEQSIEIEDSFLSEPTTHPFHAPSYRHFVTGRELVTERGRKDEETIESH